MVMRRQYIKMHIFLSETILVVLVVRCKLFSRILQKFPAIVKCHFRSHRLHWRFASWRLVPLRKTMPKNKLLLYFFFFIIAMRGLRVGVDFVPVMLYYIMLFLHL